MPLISLPSDVPNGVRVRLRASLDRTTVAEYRLANRPIPQPIDVDAILDTGAECSCLDRALVARLGLPFYAFDFTAAPGAATAPALTIGGASVNAYHTAGLTVLHPSGVPGRNLVVPELVIAALSLRTFGVDAILGRDVLALCVLVYDGPAGAVTLAY